MKKKYFLFSKGTLGVLLFLISLQSFSQTTTIFTDDFSAYSDEYYTINPGVIGNPIPNPKWKMARSGADFGSAIGPRGLYLTNSGSTASNNNGWVLASVSSSEMVAPYSNVLSNNPGLVTWTFNMRQSRSNPSGFGSTQYGVAFILAGTNGSNNLTGTGYAVVLGNSFSTDYIRLVRYNSGIRNFTTLIQSSTSGLTDFGTNYTSVKVTYNPNNNVWQLFLRNDGSSAAANPLTGNLTSQGTATNSTYTSTSLPLLGGYLNGGTNDGFTAYYNYININVNVPYISSITPISKIAGTGSFTLTVNGENFNSSSKIMWNGTVRTTSFISSTQLTAVIGATDISNPGTSLITVVNGSTVSNSKVFNIETPGTPTLTPSVSLLNLANTVSGTSSTTSTYTLEGVNLTSNPVITAPTYFEISTNGTAFSDVLTLTRSGTSLTPQPTTIYVRTKANAPPGIYSVNVTNSVTNGITKLVNINAKVLAVQPTTQSNTLTFSEVTSSSFKINWINGNGEKRMLIIRPSSAVNAFPVDGTSYVADPVFGVGSQIGTNNFVIYSGVGSTTTVSGLSAATTYYVAVVEYNGTINGTENYLTTGNLVGNQLTRNPPTGWQIYAVNTVNTIDFDTTVDGVNFGNFQGAGLTPSQDDGELNSNAWAITGFSDGNIAFGATSAEDTDYDSGVANTAVSEGGLYAFETSSNNFSLGIQPTNEDFTPGTITLRVQNQTSVNMTSLNIGYKIYVRNDQDSSTSFNFSHSATNTSYIPVSALNVTSPMNADAVSQWKAHYRVTTITGLTVAPGNYYYLRWTLTDVGNVVYDEFALDDIVLVSNPTTNFVPFKGTAETFVLNGNAELSNDLNIENNLTFNGGKLIIGANTLTVNRTITNTTSDGIRGSSNSNLVLSGNINASLSVDQTTVGTTNMFNNVTIATTNNNTISATNPFGINGSLIINENQSLNLGIHPLTGALTSTLINGNLYTQNSSSLPLPSGKTWTGTGIVYYNAPSAVQTLVGGTYTNLTASSSGGAVAGGTLNVNGILNLPTANPSATQGSLSLGTYTLTMGGQATNTGIGDVTGDILRTSIVSNVLYTFGHKDTSIFFPAVGTLPTEIGLRIQIGTAPAWLPGAVKRIYDFKQTGGSGTKAIIKGHYLDSELNGNVESKLVDFAYAVVPGVVVEKGKSNYDTTENWIELTNADIGLDFKTTFDQVKLTFDESALSVLTWNGTVSNSWTTAANWTPTGSPSSTVRVVIPDASTTQNDPIINATADVLNLTIEAGGILNAPDNSVFTIHGNAGAWINNGIYNPGGGTSKVIFVGADATIAGSTTFNDLTIAENAVLRPLTYNEIRIGRTFTKTGSFNAGGIENTIEFTGNNQTIPVPNGQATAYHNLIINGTGAVFPASLNITGNITLNNSVNFTGKTIVMNGNTNQTIGGTNANFNNLTINNSFGNVSLTNNTSVAGTLTLNSGNLILNNSNLTIGNAVAGTFDNSKMILTNGTGEARLLFSGLGSYFFPIGESSEYTPITVNVTSGTFSNAYVGTSVKSGKHPNNYSINNYLNRYWNVNQSGISDAIATISTEYVSSEVSGTENMIAAAQLKGNFNQLSNPWLKFSSLNSNILNVADAELSSSTVSTFTGINAENLTAVITGYGSFCQNYNVYLTAQTTGGDGPFTYLWTNNLGTSATATPPTTAVGTINYGVTVWDANGFMATNNADVTVLQPTVGGILSAIQTICKGFQPNTITLSGNTGEVLYWQKSEDSTFATNTINISNITNTLTGDDAGKIFNTTYFRAVISNGNCGEVFSTPTAVQILSTTWDGNSWSNGVPNETTNAIITGNFIATTDIEACNITVENNATFTVPSNFTLIVNGAVITTSGNLKVLNNASLVQTDDSAENEGINFTAVRDALPMYRLDYTYWSSPVENQTLNNLSPLTLPTKYFGWDTYNESWIPYIGGNKTMVSGEGYIVRAPQSFSVNPAEVSTFNGVFNGKPNNGVYNISVIGTPAIAANNAFSLLGNPYPSALSADSFIQANIDVLKGTLYFWTHHTPLGNTGSGVYNYSATDYASYNFLGGTGTGLPGSGNSTPTGFIASGQGFFAGIDESGTVTINNSMRTTGNNNQFFKATTNSTLEKHRLWLNLTHTNGGFKEILVGYTTNATVGFDKGWDGELFSSNDLTLYTFINNKKMAIQSLPLPFTNSNVVALGYNTNFAGMHKIVLSAFDGLFENQNVYLHDKSLNIIHDIKASEYEFYSELGTYNERFDIVYVNSTLENSNQVLANKFFIYKNEKSIIVKSPNTTMKSIKVLDMQGRVLDTFSNINAHDAVLELSVAHQVLLISITTNDNKIVTKKLMY